MLCLCSLSPRNNVELSIIEIRVDWKVKGLSKVRIKVQIQQHLIGVCLIYKETELHYSKHDENVNIVDLRTDRYIQHYLTSASHIPAPSVLLLHGYVRDMLLTLVLFYPLKINSDYVRSITMIFLVHFCTDHIFKNFLDPTEKAI